VLADFLTFVLLLTAITAAGSVVVQAGRWSARRRPVPVAVRARHSVAATAEVRAARQLRADYPDLSGNTVTMTCRSCQLDTIHPTERTALIQIGNAHHVSAVCAVCCEALVSRPLEPAVLARLRNLSVVDSEPLVAELLAELETA
jgi:hypothetical protein